MDVGVAEAVNHVQELVDLHLSQLFGNCYEFVNLAFLYGFNQLLLSFKINLSFLLGFLHLQNIHLLLFLELSVALPSVLTIIYSAII